MRDPYYVSSYPDWANCVVLDKDNKFVFVNHYRYATNTEGLEIVGGILDNHQDASAAAGIRRELLEEIGYEGGSLWQTGTVLANPSIQTNVNHCFLAAGGECTRQPELEDGVRLEIVKLSYSDIKASLLSGEIFQALHLAALLQAIFYIQNSRASELQAIRTIMNQAVSL